MLNENLILVAIELKRQEMYKAALNYGLNHSITIKISQELDKLLNSLAYHSK